MSDKGKVTPKLRFPEFRTAPAWDEAALPVGGGRGASDVKAREHIVPRAEGGDEEPRTK